MDTAFREITPPSAVHHALCGTFIDGHTPCLLIAKASLLQIYLIQSEKLYLYLQISLHGVIVNMKLITEQGRGKSLLLLAFKDAKVSVLEYDPSLHDLITVSIHYFEREEFKTRFTVLNYEPKLQVDPQNSCAMLYFYEEYFAIIPFKSRSFSFPAASSLTSDDAFLDSANAPYLPSFTLHINDLDKGIKNVLDFVFLHGYTDPTIAILFEPKQTFHGRQGHRSDTVCLMMFSLSIHQRQYTCIQKIDGLPFTCWKLEALPQPTGGVLVLGTTILVHADQISPGCMVGVNPMSSDETMHKDIRVEPNLFLNLNGCVFQYLSKDICLLALRNGDLYVAKFIREGRFVSDIRLERTGTSITPSCSCLIDSSLMFLGSRIGDSLVIKYSPISETAAKQSSVMEQDVNLEEDMLDEDEIFSFSSKERTDGHRVSPYQFSVADSLFTLGPVRDMAVGYINENKRDLQLVACTGHSKNAALAILSTSVRLSEVTKSMLHSDCQQIWSLAPEQESFHRFMLISKQASTMVLKIGAEDIQEMSKSLFHTNGPTLHCACVDSCFFQIHEYGIIVLDSNASTLLQNYKIQSRVKSFSWAKPYLMLLLEGGRIRCLKFESNSFQLMERPSHVDHVPIVSCSIFRDKVGAFKLSKVSDKDGVVEDNVVVEEDEIYGASMDVDTPTAEPTASNENNQVLAHYAALYRSNGVLEIHRLSSFETVFYSANFNSLPYLLDDHGLSTTSSSIVKSISDVNFTEILLIALGPYQDPYLIVKTKQNDVHIYRALAVGTGDINRLAVRFVKMANDLILREPANCQRPSLPTDDSFSKRDLIPFFNVEGYSGVFVNGFIPIMILVGPRRFIRIHKVLEHGPISSFTEMHTSFCTRGLALLTEMGELVMAEVPKGLNLDYDLPMRKIPLKRTASAITYHPETMTFVISTSVSDSFRYDRESDTMDNAAARASRFPPIIEVYKLELFSPKTWGTIDVFDLNQNEHVICLRSVSLSTSQTSSGRKSFVVVGTGINRGEDTMVRGRILVFDIIDVVPEPGRPETNFKMKLLFEKEGKGAITAISSCNGFLATATGNQLFISEFTNDDTLTKIAFFNLETYCISLNSVKNYLLMGDVYKGAWFLAYQEDPSRLALLGKDYGRMELYATEFMVDDNALYLVASDSQNCIQLFSYSPNNLHSIGGQRLLRRGDICTGSLIQKFIRICTRTMPNSRFESGIVTSNEKRQLCLFGTLDGALGFVSPIPEQQYKRLSQLYNKMTTMMVHTAGLNPKGYRLQGGCSSAATSGSPYFPNPTKTILDCQLIFRFLNLSLIDQNDLAKSIGTTSDRIYLDLIELQWNFSVI